MFDSCGRIILKIVFTISKACVSHQMMMSGTTLRRDRVATAVMIGFGSETFSVESGGGIFGHVRTSATTFEIDRCDENSIFSVNAELGTKTASCHVLWQEYVSFEYA